MKKWPGIAQQYYWEVFDPLPIDTNEKPVLGDIDDDVLDIVNDLIDGITLWHRGDEASATWEWRFSFETHWGDHLVDATRAAHRLITKARRS